MLVVALTGHSGAGKTTLIEQLIRRYRAAGWELGAIKHTHHPLNADDRGDTSRFRAAGAEPVVLAGSGAAVLFRSTGTTDLLYTHPRDLLAHFDCDMILVEGFRGLGEWPEIPIEAGRRPALEELARELDRMRSS